MREIVKAKHEESIFSKKEATKKINPEYPNSIRQLELVKPSSIEKVLPSEKMNMRKGQLDILPRIKIHSEPNEQVNYKVTELLARMK